VPTGRDFGTVTIVTHGLSYEVTTLRRDIETDGRRAVVRFGTDWTADAMRRDFTLNALYCGPDGELFDPLGGLDDCLARRVRFIGDPAARIAEDRLRVFRFYRFSASHGGEVFDPAGLAASAAAANDLAPVSPERIGHEMLRMLGLPRVARTIGEMVRAGILSLGAQSVEALSRYEQTCEQAEAPARLALLLRDGAAGDLRGAWRLSNAIFGQAEAIGRAVEVLLAGGVDEARHRHKAVARSAIAVAGAVGGWDEAKCQAIAAAIAVPAPELPVSAADLLATGYAQGPALGAALTALEDQWIASGFALDRAALMALAEARKA
jgi:poly(A) polymerase